MELAFESYLIIIILVVTAGNNDHIHYISVQMKKKESHSVAFIYDKLKHSKLQGSQTETGKLTSCFLPVGRKYQHFNCYYFTVSRDK